MEKEKIIIIDANAVMHRAYHAIPPLSTKKGDLVNVVYGFVSVLLRVVKEFKPNYAICAFDSKGKTFRNDIYKEYKAGRKKPEQEFYDQIPIVKEVVKTLNIPILEKAGFEADDIIGSVANKIMPTAEKIIVTGDMDILQLVNENTKVYVLKRGIKETILYDKKAVAEKYGLSPKQIIDFKGLRGDMSDNIPGIKGIGEKGAIELLKNFGSIENIYKKIEDGSYENLIKPKIKEKLASQKNNAFMSKDLATIRKNIDVKFDLKNCKLGNYNKENLNNLFRKLEFYSLIDRIEKTINSNTEKDGFECSENFEPKFKNQNYVNCVIIDTLKKLDEFLNTVESKKEIIFQTIARNSKNDNAIKSGKDENLEEMYFLFEENCAFFVPLSFCEKPNLFESGSYFLHPKSSEFLKKIKRLFEDENCKKIGYSLKNQIKNLKKHNISLSGIYFDVIIAAYLLDSGKRNYEINKIAFDHLGVRKNIKVKIDKEKNNKETGYKFQHIIEETIKLDLIFALYKKLKKEIEEEKMENLFYKIEMPLVGVLAEMEEIGIKLNVEFLKEISETFDRKISELDYKIHKFFGDDNLSINSSKQLASALFDKMKLPTANIRKTQTGYSVSASELEKLQGEHPVIDLILEYRELSKLKNTYIDTMPKLMRKETGRIHTIFHQTITSTGRLSSSGPNLQNIPARTEIGRKIRQAFITERGRKFLSADYSQIELRIIAEIANDEEMKKIFANGLDIHTATAAEINKVSIEDVTDDMRQAAKALNFGVIYGMSAFGFARSAKITKEKAKKFINDYMKKFCKVSEYIEKSKKDARKNGYVKTLFGRKRYIPEINSKNAVLRNAAERMAVNMPIQGTAADIIKIAMINVNKWIKKFNKRNKDAVWLLLQVHDELLFSVKDEFLNEVSENVKKIMENCYFDFGITSADFSTPIKVDIKIGDNWGEMNEF